MIRYLVSLWDDHRELILVGLLVLVLGGLVAGLVRAAVEEQREWDAFAAEHACQVVRVEQPERTSTTAPVIDGEGNAGFIYGTSVRAGRVTYRCDDGVEYVRSR